MVIALVHDAQAVAVANAPRAREGSRQRLVESADDVMRMITKTLKDRDGWNITPNQDPDCRTVGYLLDRQTLCVGVYDDKGAVGIYLQTGL